MKSIVKIIANTAIGLILLVYFFYTSSILFLMSSGVKVSCDRLEIGYVMCEQELNRLDHYFTHKKTSYRLLGAYVKGSNLYLKTDKKPVLYYSYPPLHGLENDAEEIEQYATGKGYSRFPKYLDTPKSYFYFNLTMLILGWILLIRLIYPIFEKINHSIILNKK